MNAPIRPSLPWALLCLTVLLALLVGAAAGTVRAASASEVPDVHVALNVPSPHVAAGTAVTLDATVTTSAGEPVAGVHAQLVQLRPEGPVTYTGVSDEAGRVAWAVVVSDGANTFTASSASSPGVPVTVTGHRDAATVAVSASRPTLLRRRGHLAVSVTRTPYGETAVPWAGASVLWQHRVAGQWVTSGSATADPSGRVEAAVRPGRIRVLVPGTTQTLGTDARVVVAKPGALLVQVRTQDRVVAGTPAEVRVKISGAGQRNVEVTLESSSGGPWSTVGSRRTRAALVRFTHRPPRDVSYRARAVVRGHGRSRSFTSEKVAVGVVPPVPAFVAPAGAPQPHLVTPDQPAAVGSGPNPAVARIDDAVWESMVGRTWHRGCPVGRAQLRLLRVNYYGYDGYRHRGELVAHVDTVNKMGKALSLLHDHKVQIRSMYRVDRFGWSPRLRGGDDYASMAAGNTSAFNCRDVVGRPGRTSPHSYGRALDLNPWENPFASAADGWVPNTFYAHHQAGQFTWRSPTHPVVQLLARAGLRWTYGASDAHHFDG